MLDQNDIKTIKHIIIIVIIKYVQISINWESKRSAQFGISECLVVKVKSLLMENEIRRQRVEVLALFHAHLLTTLITAVIINHLLCAILRHRLGEFRNILHVNADVCEGLFGMTDFTTCRTNQLVNEGTTHEGFDELWLVGVLQGLVNSIQEIREILVSILYVRESDDDDGDDNEFIEKGEKWI